MMPFGDDLDRYVVIARRYRRLVALKALENPDVLAGHVEPPF